MKMKKVFAAVASVAMCASMVSAFATSASALAEGTVIDFEDGDCSFVYMNDFDGGSKATISVEDYNGSKQLKISPEDCSLWPKIWFDLDSITDRSNTTQIYTIDMDVSIVPRNSSEAIGWVGAYIASSGGFDSSNIQSSQKNPAWSQADFTDSLTNTYVEGEAVTGHGQKKFLLASQGYSDKGTNPFFALMINVGDSRTVDFDIYVDNIVIAKKDGTALPVGGVTAETEAVTEAETEAAVEETTAAETEAAATEAVVTEAAAEETAAPATEAAAEDTAAAPAETTAAPADNAVSTPVASTGNAPVAAMAVVMVASAAAAVIAKRK